MCSDLSPVLIVSKKMLPMQVQPSSNALLLYNMIGDKSRKKSVIATIEPTGTGQANLGIAIAKGLSTEVVSADSL